MKGSVDAHRLWYARPAAHWHEAMPLGNGRIGAMIFGDACRERIGLNEAIRVVPTASIRRPIAGRVSFPYRGSLAGRRN